MYKLSLITATLGFLVTPLAAQNAMITWGSAVPVATTAGNSSDVSTNGDLIEAYNAVANDHIDTEVPVTVNGVTFTPTTALLDGDPRNGGPGDFSANTNGGDPEYDILLSRLEFGGGTDLVTLELGDGDGDTSITGTGLLVPGENYEIQIWYLDTRPAQDDRITPVGDGNGNIVELNDAFAIGTFTADSTTQNITLESPGFGQAHITAYQIRNISSDPSPTVALSTDSETVSGPYTVDVTFSEDVTDLTDSDFVVTNGSASGISPATGPATNYTVTITPDASGFVSVNLPAETVQDTTLNDNSMSNTLSTLFIPADAEQATPTLSTTATEPVSIAYIVDVVFDEDVSGLDAADFTVIGGTASDVLPATGSASVYTVTITPSVEGFVDVTLPASSTLDSDDNLPNLASNTLSIQFSPPSIPTPILSNPATGSVVSGSYSIDISFSEEVTDLDASDFVVTNGTASNLTPAAGPAESYTLDITPTATGLVSVFLPSGSVMDVDGEEQTNSDSRFLYTNNLPAGTFTTSLIDLSGRDFLGLGDGESNGFFLNPKTFDAISDLSMNDIPWTDGVNSGTFDLSFVATSSLTGIRRGGRGAFGTAADDTGSALIDNGASITLDSLAVSDLQGDLAGATISNIQFVAIYLGNQTDGDAATIDDIMATGAPGGISLEEMRNDIELSPTATIAGTGGDGFSLNAIAITFDVSAGFGFPQIINTEFNGSSQLVLTATGLNPTLSYELLFSPDLETPFTAIPGTSKIPTDSTDTFIDPDPILPGRGFYRLGLTP